MAKGEGVTETFSTDVLDDPYLQLTPEGEPRCAVLLTQDQMTLIMRLIRGEVDLTDEEENELDWLVENIKDRSYRWRKNLRKRGINIVPKKPGEPLVLHHGDFERPDFHVGNALDNDDEIR